MTRPNWRNREEYLYDGSGFWTENQFYAWQFIRRNLDYRKCYQRELSRFKKRILEKGISDIDETSPWFIITPEDRRTAWEWGLNWLCDPDDDNPYIQFRETAGAIHLNKTDLAFHGVPKEMLDEMDNSLNVPRGSAAVLFDLRFPITPQIKYAKRVLLKNQKGFKDCRVIKTFSPKSHQEAWIAFLRIYDADSEGIETKEIASVIYKGENNDYPDYPANDKVRKNLEAAKKLINGGYLKYILTPE